MPQKHAYVVSEYIPKPLLINGLKFDLRIYVAITSVNPLRIYVYEEGLARFATEKYDQGFRDTANVFSHLTNYSINKKNERFIKPENQAGDASMASKWSLAQLKEYIIENRIGGISK